MKVISFILNIPWTLLGIFLALISIPHQITINQKLFVLIFRVRSLWWSGIFPYMKGIRGAAIGSVVILNKNKLPNDLEHELVHVEQYQREPLIHPFLYAVELMRKGYRGNKYEKEAYERGGNEYLG